MITIYSKDHCPNCEIAHAQALLYGVRVEIVKLTPETIPAFKEKYPMARSTPFVVKDDEVIGGLDKWKKWLKANV